MYTVICKKKSEMLFKTKCLNCEYFDPMVETGFWVKKNLHQTLSQYFMGEVNNDRTWQKITEFFAMHYWIRAPNKMLWLTDDLLRQTESG